MRRSSRWWTTRLRRRRGRGMQSRNDSEAVLKIDPQYADAQMAVGIQQFAVASLPRFVRMMVGIMGVGGNKEKGLADAARGGGAWRGDQRGVADGAVAVSAA